MTYVFAALAMLFVTATPSDSTPPPAEKPVVEKVATAEESSRKPNDSPTKVTSSKLPYSEGKNDHYVVNKAPLKAFALIPLPTGNVLGREWLDVQLRLLLRANDNFYVNMPQLSRHLGDDSGWLKPDKPGGEEVPLWLRGYGHIAYIYKDVVATELVKKWLDAMIASQDEDGYFGPKANKAERNYWPNMIAVQALQLRYEAVKDERILPFLTRYFRFRNNLPLDELYPHKIGDLKDHARWVQNVRAVEELESVYWLYNRTGEDWLLKLAEKIQAKGGDWSSGRLSELGTDIAIGLREPAVRHLLSGDEKLLDAVRSNYQALYDDYGQVPGGMFAAAPRLRKGRSGPEQPVEGCAIIEMMNTTSSLLSMTGEAEWADRCEDIAFNTFPAFLAPDNRAVRRLSAPNMIQADKGDKSPVFEVKGMSTAFDPRAYDCCLHNAGAGWARWTQALWYATPGNGLAAAMYAPSEVRARVGRGVDISIHETTEYPFGDEIEFRIETPEPVAFPLSLRIPEWCENGRVSVNGDLKMMKPAPRAYVILERTWKDGDTVRLQLPMEVRTRTWKTQGDAVSIHRGPLAYSLRIREEWTRSGDKTWPTYEVKAESPWNYALFFDSADLSSAFEVIPRTGTKVGQLFYVSSAPHSLKTRGYLLADWKADERDIVGPIPKSPVKVPAVSPEEIELIPMGCARLRISVFPVAQPES